MYFLINKLINNLIKKNNLNDYESVNNFFLNFFQKKLSVTYLQPFFSSYFSNHSTLKNNYFFH